MAAPPRARLAYWDGKREGASKRFRRSSLSPPNCSERPESAMPAGRVRRCEAAARRAMDEEEDAVRASKAGGAEVEAGLLARPWLGGWRGRMLMEARRLQRALQLQIHRQWSGSFLGWSVSDLARLALRLLLSLRVGPGRGLRDKQQGPSLVSRSRLSLECRVSLSGGVASRRWDGSRGIPLYPSNVFSKIQDARSCVHLDVRACTEQPGRPTQAAQTRRRFSRETHREDSGNGRRTDRWTDRQTNGTDHGEPNFHSVLRRSGICSRPGKLLYRR